MWLGREGLIILSRILSSISFNVKTTKVHLKLLADGDFISNFVFTYLCT